MWWFESLHRSHWRWDLRYKRQVWRHIMPCIHHNRGSRSSTLFEIKGVSVQISFPNITAWVFGWSWTRYSHKVWRSGRDIGPSIPVCGLSITGRHIVGFLLGLCGKAARKHFETSGRSAGKEAQMMAIVTSSILQTPSGSISQEMSVVVARTFSEWSRRIAMTISLMQLLASRWYQVHRACLTKSPD